jgi:pimeloyl-ACP methyl ester carboxylesterase
MKSLFFSWMLLLHFLIIAHCKSPTIKLQGKIFHPTTSDGWLLTLEHFPPSKEISRKYPVILCHGLAANRNYFKINEDNSIVALLQEKGFDVFLLDLRGRKDAESPSLWFGNKTYSYNFDDYVNLDIDTAISEVIRITGASKVNWIGHSMGGMIAYARLGAIKEDRIANLITFGSPFSFPEPNNTIKSWKKYSVLLPFIPIVPVATLAKWREHIKFLKYSEAGAGNMVYWEINIDQDIVKTLRLNGVIQISTNELSQFSHWTEDGSIRSKDGLLDYTSLLNKIHVPTLLVWGTRDNLAPAHVVRNVFENLGSKDKSIQIVGRSQGHSEDYGHTDLLIGRNAYKESLIPAIDWLVVRNPMVMVKKK